MYEAIISKREQSQIQTPSYSPMTASAGRLTALGTVFGIGCDA
jgi:hypothetical protein